MCIITFSLAPQIISVSPEKRTQLAAETTGAVGRRRVFPFLFLGGSAETAKCTPVDGWFRNPAISKHRKDVSQTRRKQWDLNYQPQLVNARISEPSTVAFLGVLQSLTFFPKNQGISKLVVWRSAVQDPNTSIGGSNDS